MSKADRARIFNTIMPIVNHIWASDITGIPVNPSRIGPDLIGKRVSIELKFTLVNGNESTHPMAWTVEESQFEYHSQRRPCFWGFATYEFSRQPSSLTRFSPQLLRKLVGRREIYLAPPNFVKDNYKGSLTQGCSRKGVAWSRVLYYPKLKEIVDSVKTAYTNEQGTVYLMEGVPEEEFTFSSCQSRASCSV